ncbi:MAG: ribonuclease E/G [Planctomycetota bacterium]|nr:ribonuclease E/G [Planctomycetota bacterium]
MIRPKLLVAIDVNTGKLKADSLDKTLLETNLLAAREIARQIRLRDLAGLIVIDFIDMDNPSHRTKLEQEFNKHLEVDKARETVTKLSEFCLMELTRQRQRPSLSRALFRTCPTCEGRGVLQSIPTVVLAFMRRVRKAMAQDNVVNVEATVHPEVAAMLLNEKRREMSKLEDYHNCGMSIITDSEVGREDIRVVAYLENEEKLVIE